MFFRAAICAFIGLGVGLDDAPLLGFTLGGALGLLWGRLTKQSDTIENLQRELSRVSGLVTDRLVPAARASAEPAPAPKPLVHSAPIQATEPRPVMRPPQATPAQTELGVEADDSVLLERARNMPPRQPDAFERGIAVVRDWLFTGNVPVKVGVIVSFFGVAFLLKYAADAGLFTLPIQFRMVGVALGGIAMLVIGWRLRLRQPVYALTIQGGGIGVIYLTAFAAFRLYHLLPASLAFGFLVLLTFGTAALAVLQRSQTLAIAGIVGGFLAPVLVSTGSGSHVALFSYYLVLNCAIAGIAWFMAWRPLNWLGFVFTFAIGTAWGFRAYAPEHFATTEPFLIGFFLLYVFIALTFALRHGPQLKGYVDGTLVFGLPLAAFALQWQLLKPDQMQLAWTALAMAGLYLSLAVWMLRVKSVERRLLAECFIALGAGFATIAIPLALDAKWTAASWSLEGAGLIWVAVRQGRLLSRWSGVALQVLAALSLLRAYPDLATSPALLNGRFMGGLMLTLGATISALMLERGPARHADLERGASYALIALATAWWYATGLREIGVHLGQEHFTAAAVLFVALSAWLSKRAGLWRQSTVLLGASVVGLPGMLALAWYAAAERSHPSADFGWLAWPAALLLNEFVARGFLTRMPEVARAISIVGFWLGCALLGWELHWQMGELARGSVWPWATVAVLWAALAHLVGTTRVAQHLPDLGGKAAGAVGLAALGVAVALVLGSRGDPRPLPYIPLANPIDLAAAVAALALVFWLRRQPERFGLQARQVALGLAALGFVVVTMDVVRAAHHWSAMPFRLSAAMRHDDLQAALSIVWATLGVVGMFLGARSARRLVWVSGAALMAVVVTKLFLIDLGNTGTLARIVSFMGVGVLLLIIGYLAPIPARHAESSP